VFDFWEYKVPHPRAESALIRRKCPISPGILTDIRVYFPLGVNSVAKARVYIGEKPVLPRSAGSYVTGDGIDVGAIDIFEPITGNLPVLNWDVWNESTKYDHTLQLKATWITEEEMTADRILLTEMLNRLDSINKIIGGT
jgi:hypothetical protein